MADGPDNHPDQGFNHPTASVVPISGISRTGLSQAPRTVIATAPGTAGGPPLYAFVSTDRLQPLTALDNHNAAVRHDHVRPGNFPPPAAFTTSPGPSEPNSPAVPSPNIISLPQSPSRIHGPCNPPRRELDTVQKRSSSLPSPVIISQPPTPVQPSTSTQHTPPTNGRRSVKHLTCFWWWTRGRCRYSEDECLYAHHDTGMYTDAPRQLVPGEPARAGRSLERALENLQRQRSSGSLNNLAISRPGTPGLQTTPDHNHRHAQGQPEGQLASLVADKEFLRNQVEKHSMERTILLSSVDSLQNENNDLKKFLTQLQDECDQLRSERDSLRITVEQTQQRGQSRAIESPYGVIGGERRASSTNNPRNDRRLRHLEAEEEFKAMEALHETVELGCG